MADNPPKYYRTRKGKAYWEPGKFAALYGERKSVPLGSDGAEARKKAIDLNDNLDQKRKAVQAAGAAATPPPPTYRNGSLGWFYNDFFKDTEAWGQIEPATRAEYDRVWPIIAKRFGNALVTKITANDSEKFHVDIHPRHKNDRDPAGEMKLSWDLAWRTLKIWRGLLNALVDYEFRPTSPEGRISNPTPPPRDHVWIDPEIATLIADARKIRQHGMAVAIRLGWDSMMSPVDVRLLKISGLATLGQISTARKKTLKKVRAAITATADTEIAEYLALLKKRGLDVSPDLPLIRKQNGKPYSGGNGASDFRRDFAKVRAVSFPKDDRRFQDIRRSAATEAKMGDATKDDIGTAMSNRLGQDETLQSTYLVDTSTRVLEARARGRQKMIDKFRNGGAGSGSEPQNARD